MGGRRVYGRWMRLVPAARRDVWAHPGDYGLAGAMVAVALVALASRIDVQDADDHVFRPDTWWAWVVTLSICAVLVGRRRWPLASLALAVALVVPLELARQRDTVAFFAVAIALYSVAAHLPAGQARWGVALVTGLYAVLAATGTVALSAVPLLGPGFLIAAFALGTLIHRGRARQRRDVDAAIEQAAAAIEIDDLHAADERLRLARELHDVVAHSLSVIAVQAGIGAHLVERQPAEAARSLDAIRATCVTTRSELTRLVSVLRHGSSGPTDPAAGGAVAPPGIGDVTGLVEQIRATGVPVTLALAGDLSAVPDGASLAAFRIVQEALTNVVRHAGPAATASVTIDADGTDLSLVIDDDGRGDTTPTDGVPTGGHGLLGMAERARLYGGVVEAGPRPGGGFRVRTTLHGDIGAGAGTGTAPPGGPAPQLGDDRPTGARTGPSDARRWRLSPAVADAGLATAMAVLAMAEVATAHATATGPQFSPTHLGAVILRLACAAALAIRRRHPGLAYAAAWVPALALSVTDHQVGVMVFALWIGLYSVAAYAPRRQLAAAVAGTGAGLVVVARFHPPDLSGAGAAWAAVFFAASAVAGFVVRRDRDRRRAELEEQTAAAAARTRQAQLALVTERLRIADELSTVISRSIGTIAQRAGTGRHVATGTGSERAALETISQISRDALSDLRRLLAHLRTTGEQASHRPVDPPPGHRAVDPSVDPAPATGTGPEPGAAAAPVGGRR